MRNALENELLAAGLPIELGWSIVNEDELGLEDWEHLSEGDGYGDD